MKQSVEEMSASDEPVVMQTIETIFETTVRKRRLKQGLSQEAFADKEGIHRTHAGSIELGKVAVSIEIAMKFAVAVETPLSKIWRDVEVLPPQEDAER